MGFCHATNKSSDKEEIPRRHKAASASAEETSPAFVWEFINLQNSEGAEGKRANTAVDEKRKNAVLNSEFSSQKRFKRRP